MTVKELSQLYCLRKEIERYERRLKELEQKRGLSSVLIDDMPHGKGPVHSQVEELAAEMTDLKAIILAKRIECVHEQSRLERYVATIPDSRIRLVIALRFIDCLSWPAVAEAMSGQTVMDESTVRKLCYRYLDETEGRQEEKEAEGEGARHEMRGF